MSTERPSEADRNYEAFVTTLPSLSPDLRGKYALMHDAGIVSFHDNSLSATLEGIRTFGQGEFSVQEVAAEPEHLGFYSYVGGTGQC
jgi:hypothetical protein